MGTMPIKKRVAEVTANTGSGKRYVVQAKHFVAGFVTRRERVAEADPVLHWTMGLRFDKVREVCSSRGWELKEKPKEKP